MAAMKEHIKLVTDFAELKQGDQILLSSCTWCGQSHRMSLTRYNAYAVGYTPSRRIATDVAWETDLRSHRASSSKFVLLGRRTVQRRVVYLILPGADEETERERSMELEDA